MKLTRADFAKKFEELMESYNFGGRWRESKHAKEVPNLGAKLKYWDYKNVLEIHDALGMINESINSLGLVPQGF